MSDATVTATEKPKRVNKATTKAAPAKKAAVKKAAPKKAAPKAAETKTAPKRTPKPKAAPVEQRVADAAIARADASLAKANEAAVRLTDALVEGAKTAKKFAQTSLTADEAARAFEAAAPRAAAPVEPDEPPIKGSHAIQRAPLHRPAKLRYDARPVSVYSPSESFPYGGFAAKTMSKKEIHCLNAASEIRYLRRSMADQLLALR